MDTVTLSGMSADYSACAKCSLLICVAAFLLHLLCLGHGLDYVLWAVMSWSLCSMAVFHMSVWPGHGVVLPVKQSLAASASKLAIHD